MDRSTLIKLALAVVGLVAAGVLVYAATTGSRPGPVKGTGDPDAADTDSEQKGSGGTMHMEDPQGN